MKSRSSWGLADCFIGRFNLALLLLCHLNCSKCRNRSCGFGSGDATIMNIQDTTSFDAPRPRTQDFLELVQRSKRGRLKLYLGFAAGVGKTYRMLEEAHALRKRGTDIVVAFVETHSRAETAALINGVEVVPRKRSDYRGLTVEEMDLDAVLARRPEIAIVDELPHTNVPGSRHTKRYQDVLDLLGSWHQCDWRV